MMGWGNAMNGTDSNDIKHYRQKTSGEMTSRTLSGRAQSQLEIARVAKRDGKMSPTGIPLRAGRDALKSETTARSLGPLVSPVRFLLGEFWRLFRSFWAIWS